jgi:hypothetical protein
MFENDSDLKKIVSRLDIDTDTNPDHRDSLRRQMLSVFQQTQKTPPHPPSWQIIGRTIMKKPITKLTAAAVIIIAVLIGINQFGGKLDGTSTAWADALERIYLAQAVTYKQTFQPEGKPSFTTERMIIEPGLTRSVLPHGDIMITDFTNGKSLHLMVLPKKALITQRIGQKQRGRLFNYLDWLRKLHEEEAEFIGQEEINGMMTDVFVSEVPFEKTTVWVDPKTNLPVKVEEKMTPNADKDIIAPSMSLSMSDFGEELKITYDVNSQTVTTHGMTKSIVISSGRGSGKGIHRKMTITMHDFAWDVKLDESLFSLEPPEGYTVEKEQFDASEESENDLIYALAFWAEMSDGMFPSKINDLGDPNKVKPLLIKKFDKDGDAGEELDQAMNEAHKILKGLYFSQEKKADKNWNYVGGRVRLGEAGTQICWWYAEDSDDYRVIYGDLSIGNSLEIPEPQEDE